MFRFFLISALVLFITSCSTTGRFQTLNVAQMDHIMGQWDYELLGSDGVKVRGFFQIDPSSRKSLSVRGQSYLDKDDKALNIANLRGVWKGVMKHGDQHGQYVMTFSTKDNPIFPNSLDEKPQEGTVIFHHEENLMTGSFKHNNPKNGPSGTIVAHKRK